MEFLGRLLLVLLGAYGLMGVVIAAHRVRRRYGLDLLFLLLGGLVVYTWWVVRLDLDLLRVGQFRFSVSTLAFYSVIFSSVLLVYAADGVRLAQRLIHGIVALEFVFVLLDGLTSQLVRLSPKLAERFPVDLYSPAYGEVIWSISTLFLSLYIVVIAYHLIIKYTQSWPRSLNIFVPLTLALWFDATTYLVGLNLFGFFDERGGFVSMLIGELLSRALIAAGLMPVLLAYLKRSVDVRDQELASQGALDIFRSAEMLQQSLRKFKAMYHSLFDQSNDAVMVLNPQGFVEQANNSFYEWTGYRPSDLDKLHYTSLVHPDHRPNLVEQFSILLSGGYASDHMEVGILDNQGRLWPCEWKALLIGGEPDEDKPTGVQVVLRNLYNDKLLEKHHHLLSVSSAIEDYKNALAARLKEPLRQLAGQGEGGEPSGDSTLALASNHESVKALLDLFEDDMSLTSEPLEPALVKNLVSRALESFKDTTEARGIDVSTEYLGQEPKVLASRSLFMKLLSNLLELSLDRMKEDGQKLQITVRMGKLRTGRLQTVLEIAFPAEVLPESWANLLTSEDVDLPSDKEGLMLAFARAVVQDHRGRFTLEQENGWTTLMLSFNYEIFELNQG